VIYLYLQVPIALPVLWVHPEEALHLVLLVPMATLRV